MIRRFLQLLAIGATLAACGGSTEPVVQTTVTFKVDAATCTGGGTAAVDFFVDGTRVGTESLAAGASSKPYTVAPGTHILSAAASNNGGLIWPNQTANVQAGGNFLYLLTC